MINMAEKQHNECKYWRLTHSEEKGIFYMCQHYESEVNFNDAICENYTKETDLFNIWG